MSTRASWLHHLTIMKKARKHGHLFPAFSQSPQSAPMGSHETPTQGMFWSRLRHEATWFRHSTHHLSLNNWPSLHILHLTDIHLRGEDSFLDKVIQEVEGYHPDLIVITGDIVTKGWTLRALDRFLSALPNVPTYAILGNWEYWVAGNLADWKLHLARHQVQLLVEEMVMVDFQGQTLRILGTDDHLAGFSQPEKLCANLSGEPTLCLTHSPAHFEQLANYPIDLTLAGHAHGGQIRLPHIGALWTPRGTKHYVAGWYTNNHRHLFVSRGLGWSVAPIRWKCPPEIAHIFINKRL